MAAIGCLPLQATWLQESPAFRSADAAVVRASFQMLDQAWRAVPAGTLPANPGILAPLIGLSEEQLARNFDTLSVGWQLRDGRIVHDGMYDLALRLWTLQADALDHLSATSPLVTQSPEDFQLVSQEAVGASPLKGRRRLPPDFGLTAQLRDWLRSTLLVTEVADQDFLMNKFVDYARTYNEKYANPEAAFRLFASRENLRNLPSRRPAPAAAVSGDVVSRMTRFGNSGASATARNHETLDRVMGQRAAPAERNAA